MDIVIRGIGDELGIVALMIAAVQPKPGDRALEIGTGSGYAAAVLAQIVSAVYTVERLAGLAESAARRLAALGYENATSAAATARSAGRNTLRTMPSS